jgi:hypothetical protein
VLRSSTGLGATRSYDPDFSASMAEKSGKYELGGLDKW